MLQYKQKSIFIALSFSLIFFTWCSATQAADKSFLWKVQSTKSVVYLFGSIHFAKPDLYPLKPVIESAFANSSVLVVEINMNQVDPADTQKEILKNGMYPHGDSLDKHVDKETLSLLETFLKKQNIPLKSMLSTKPGFLAMTLNIMQLVRMGYLPQYGLDQYFLNKASKNKDMTIKELESVEEQLSLFFKLPDQSSFLKYTLKQFDHMEQQIADIINTWRSGNTQAMTRLIVDEPKMEYPELAKIYELMFTQRNQKMLKKILGYLESPNTYFVVVGAGHLVGDNGIVTLLKNKGYSVKQL